MPKIAMIEEIGIVSQEMVHLRCNADALNNAVECLDSFTQQRHGRLFAQDSSAIDVNKRGIRSKIVCQQLKCAQDLLTRGSDIDENAINCTYQFRVYFLLGLIVGQDFETVGHDERHVRGELPLEGGDERAQQRVERDSHRCGI